MDIQLAPWLSVHGGVDYSRRNTLYYWQRDAGTGLFNYLDAGSSQITELRGGAGWEGADWLELRGSLITYTAAYPAGSAFAGHQFIPYRPRIRLPLQAAIRLPSAFLLTVDGELSGKRQVDYAGSTPLPGYTLLNATVSRDFGSKVTILLSAVNLLNESYGYWEQYPETGIQVLLGLKAKF